MGKYLAKCCKEDEQTNHEEAKSRKNIKKFFHFILFCGFS